MTPKIEDRAIFKLFDSLGPNPKHLKYVSASFDTWEEYYKTLSRYMGLGGSVQALKQHIIDEANQMLSSENSPCEGVVIRMYDIGIEKDMTNRQSMYNYLTHGFGSKISAYFAFTEPEDWECPEPIAIFPDDPGEYYSDGECFDDKCLMDTMSDITRHISNKYGINTNIEGTPESRMRGNIRIQKY